MGYRGKLAAAFAAVFLTGALCGGTAGFLLNPSGRPGPRQPQGWWEDRLLGKIQREARLSPEQVAQVRPLVSDAVTKLRKDRTQAMLANDGVIDAMLAEVAGRLPAEQKARLDGFRARRHARLLAWVSGD